MLVLNIREISNLFYNPENSVETSLGAADTSVRATILR